MASERKLTVVLAGDSSKLKRELDKAQGHVSTFGSKVGGVAKNAGLALAGIGGGGVLLGKSFVDAATESLKVTKQTEAVIASMGNAAGVSAEHVAMFAENWAGFTGIDDEVIQSGQNVLLTFGNIRNDLSKGIRTFDEASVAALNMSTALGTDVQSAAMAVGKALNDPTKGLAKLTRQGIQFTKEQAAQVKWMQATGDMAGAQAVILGELRKQFGGSAMAQATAGDRLRVVWGNLQEDLGMKLLPVIEKVATWLSNELPGAVDTAMQWFDRISSTVQGVVAVFQEEGLGGVFSRLGQFIEEQAPIVGEKLLELGGKLIDWIAPQIEPMLGKLGEFLGAAATWILDTGLPMLAEGIGVLIPALWEWITDPEDGAIVKLIEKLPEFAEAFSTWVREEMLPSAFEGGQEIGVALISGLFDALGESFQLPEGAELHIPGLGEFDLPGRAFGGPVRRGQPVVVGERRPELFVPPEGGRILPRVQTGGSGSAPLIEHLEVVQMPGEDSVTTAMRELHRIRLLAG